MVCYKITFEDLSNERIKSDYVQGIDALDVVNQFVIHYGNMKLRILKVEYIGSMLEKK